MSVLSLPIEPQNAKNGDMYYNSVEQKYYSFKDGEWVEQVDTENATSIVQEVVDDEGYLKNTSTGTDSITIGGTPIVSSVKNGVNIGVNSTATRTGATAVGMTALAEGANATAIGNGAKVVNNSHKATALGYHAFVTGAESAIQLGYGTNSTPKTLSVGFYDDTTPVNYELLSADGTIPSARMPSDVLKNATTQTNGLAILGTTTAAANATAIGKDSLASYITTAVGTTSKSYGIMSTSVGAWSNAGNSANVVSAIAIGAGSQALASGAIQIGNGINNEAKTLKVALTDSQNIHAATDEASGLFTLLDSSGKIPMARLPFQKVCESNTALTSDGTNCEWVITHNLGTKDVMVSVYDLTTDVEPLYNVEHTSTNTITIIFNSATDIPADSYRAVIIG